MLNRHIVSSALVASLMLAVSPALAQDPGKPCQADVKKLCPNVKPDGHGALLNCLEGKQDQISVACKDAVQAKVQMVMDACKGDLEKFCSTVSPGEGKIIQCLKKNQAQVSAGCKNVFAKAKAKAQSMQKAQ
jgi:hypothetical protein